MIDTTSPEILRAKARCVHSLRQDVARLDEEARSLQEAFQVANRAFFDLRQGRRAALAEAETGLRECALAAFKATGNAKPGPGILVKITSHVIYDTAEAEKWARQHDMFLRLDAKSFEQFARNNPNQLGDLVIIEQAPQATIATDLGKALAD